MAEKTGLPSTERLDSFVDAVLAIIVTLMAVELSVPGEETIAQQGLGSALLNLWPDYLAFVFSFLLVGQVWASHHFLWRLVRVTDKFLLFLVILHLMFVSFVPFVTQLLADQFLSPSHERTVSSSIYAVSLLLNGISFNLCWWRVQKQGFLSEEVSPTQRKAMTKRYLMGPLAALLALGLAFVSFWMSLSIYVLLIVFYFWPGPEVARHVQPKENV